MPVLTKLKLVNLLPISSSSAYDNIQTSMSSSSSTIQRNREILSSGSQSLGLRREEFNPTRPRIQSQVPYRESDIGRQVSPVHRTYSPRSPHNSNSTSACTKSYEIPSSDSSTSLEDSSETQHLNKLKKFLTTLQQFGFDISTEIGEKVRGLVLALVNSVITIEDFHVRLQEETNFPLRPFVIPFLKINLPHLQQELSRSSALTHRESQRDRPPPLSTSAHRVSHGERPTPSSSTLSHGAPQGPPRSDLSKPSHFTRRSPGPCSSHSSGSSSLDPIYPDVNDNCRLLRSPDGRVCARRVSRPMSRDSCSDNERISPYGCDGYNLKEPIRLQDFVDGKSLSNQQRTSSGEDLNRNRLLLSLNNLREYDSMCQTSHNDAIDDDWKHIENLLQCIVGMVEKCKHILSTMESRSDAREGDDDDMSTNYLQTHWPTTSRDKNESNDERTQCSIGNVVSGVKLETLTELQKAVASAELTAAQMIASERARMELAVMEVRKLAKQDALAVVGYQTNSAHSCKNCGRTANETCSGCHMVRYCGSFCQHKHWQNHQKVCRASGSILRTTASMTTAAVVGPKSDTSSGACPDHVNAPAGQSLSSTRSSRSSIDNGYHASGYIPLVKRLQLDSSTSSLGVINSPTSSSSHGLTTFSGTLGHTLSSSAQGHSLSAPGTGRNLICPVMGLSSVAPGHSLSSGDPPSLTAGISSDMSRQRTSKRPSTSSTPSLCKRRARAGRKESKNKSKCSRFDDVRGDVTNNDVITGKCFKNVESDQCSSSDTQSHCDVTAKSTKQSQALSLLTTTTTINEDESSERAVIEADLEPENYNNKHFVNGKQSEIL